MQKGYNHLVWLQSRRKYRSRDAKFKGLGKDFKVFKEHKYMIIVDFWVKDFRFHIL